MKKLLILWTLTLFFATSAFADKVVDKSVPSQEVVMTVLQNGRVLQLQNVTVGGKFEVLSLVGVKVFEKRIESQNQTITIDLPKGYYIVKFGETVRKIAVK